MTSQHHHLQHPPTIDDSNPMPTRAVPCSSKDAVCHQRRSRLGAIARSRNSKKRKATKSPRAQDEVPDQKVQQRNVAANQAVTRALTCRWVMRVDCPCWLRFTTTLGTRMRSTSVMRQLARVTDSCVVVRGTQSNTTVDLTLGHGRSYKSVDRQAAESHRAQLAL